MINPNVVPKKSLKIAPVYPIITETSKCNNINIRDKVIGFKAVIPTIIFSIGYSENWNIKKNTIPSNIKEKNNHSIIEIPIPLALSRVKIELKNAMATNTMEIKQPTPTIINPMEEHS